jgi:addiction module RelB/DinJ family antitoxin
MTTVISLKLDSKVKDDAAALAKSAGLTLSGLVNSYLKQVTASRRIDIHVPEEATPKLNMLIAQLEKDIASGNLSKEYTDVEEFIADLKK